jgi:DNA mismatch repair protein MutL
VSAGAAAGARPPRIAILPPEVASKIAAGEVIERPAAVVKELVENALDARATRVEVTVAAGGRRLVQVADDGEGMTAPEARLALERHATSKIRTDADLLRIATYGFRGEALASIAAVSRLTLLSRTRDALSGTRIEVDGGQVAAAGPAGAPPGTTVVVRDLFFNTPARRQFLRSAATESAQIVDAVARLALARPDVAVSLVADGRTVFVSRRDASLGERLDALIGPDAPPLVEVAAQEGGDGERPGISVRGLVSAPGVSRAGAASLYLFVNGRAVRDRAILHAVLQGSRHAHEPGRYPVGALFVDLPPDLVDVNVHPQKTEVRFREPATVHGMVVRAVEGALLKAGALPARLDERPAAGGAAAGGASLASAHAGRVEEALAGYFGRATGAEAHGATEHAGDATGAAPGWSGGGRPPAGSWLDAARDARFAGLRYLGQLRASYLLCEGEAGLVVVDQHAAHERLRFERLRRARAAAGPVSTPLLVPRTVALRSDRAALVVERAPVLAAVGLVLEPFGPGGTLRVTAVPLGLEREDPAPLLDAVAADLEGAAPDAAVDELVAHLLATVACHGAVTFRQALRPDEARALLADLDRYEVTGACPHGRPVSRLVRFDDLERLFQRR